MAEKEGVQPIIIKKIKKGGHGHHGGAWKVAYADFVTAMMAFFLMLWLMGSTTKEQKLYIAGYFKDPSGISPIGPGGAAPGAIPKEDAVAPPPQGILDSAMSNLPGEAQQDVEKKVLRKLEQEQLEKLQSELENIFQTDPVFAMLKDQLLTDITPMGLRIHITDRDDRPNFNSGSAQMNLYTEQILEALAPSIDKVPNRISITGHTDSTPFGHNADYTNWELSADRANAARRALINGGYPEKKIAFVAGYADSLPFDAKDPNGPHNRRIAIVILKKEVDESLRQETGVPIQNILQKEEWTPETQVPATPAITDPASPYPATTDSTTQK